MGSRHTIEWTEERDAEIIRLKNDGYSASIIGEKIGVSKNSVMGRLCRLREKGHKIVEGRPPVSRTKRKTYFNRVESRRLRKKPELVYYQNSGLVVTDKWPAERIAQMINLWSAGKGETEISQIMDCTKFAMRGKLALLIKHGLVLRRKDGPKIQKIPFARDQARVNGFTVYGQNLLNEISSRMTGKGIDIMQLKRTSCRYMTGDSLYCGEHAHNGGWCNHHRQFNAYPVITHDHQI